MANAGRVELDLVAVGKDQVSAMLRQVDAQLKKTAGEMKSAGAETSRFSLGSLKAVRESAFWAAGAIVGVGAALVELTEALSTNEQAIKVWETTQKNVVGYLDKTRALVEQIEGLLGKPPPTQAQRAAEELLVQWDKNNQAIREAEAALAAHNKRLEDARKGMVGLLGDAAPAIQTELKEIVRLENAILDLKLQQANAESASTRLRETQIAQAQRLLEIMQAVDPYAETITVRAPRRGGGGGGVTRRLRAQRGDFFGQSAPSPGRFTSVDMSGEWFKTPAGDGGSEGGESGDGGSALARMATDAEKLRDALNGVADATSALAGDKFPELFVALSEIQTITQQMTDGKMKLGEALAASGAAALANTAKAIGGVRAEAAVRAAYEVGLGFATLANPIESAGHFTAAALLGAVAAGAGGGGSAGGRASSGGGRESASSGGPTTIVYNFSTMVTDRQQVTSALRQSQRSSRGTGHESRAGV